MHAGLDLLTSSETWDPDQHSSSTGVGQYSVVSVSVTWLYLARVSGTSRVNISWRLVPVALFGFGSKQQYLECLVRYAQKRFERWNKLNNLQSRPQFLENTCRVCNLTIESRLRRIRKGCVYTRQAAVNDQRSDAEGPGNSTTLIIPLLGNFIVTMLYRGDRCHKQVKYCIPGSVEVKTVRAFRCF